MKAKNVYLLLCVVGVVVPYMEFIPWVGQHGLNLRLLVDELFATRIGAFFGLDVVVSAIVVIAFVLNDRKHRFVKLWWLPICAVLLVGVSLALPLHLYLRELSMEASSVDAAEA